MDCTSCKDDLVAYSLCILILFVQAGLIEEWKWRAMKRMKEEALAAGQAAHFEVRKLQLFD
jgi:hypothetical protein